MLGRQTDVSLAQKEQSGKVGRLRVLLCTQHLPACPSLSGFASEWPRMFARGGGQRPRKVAGRGGTAERDTVSSAVRRGDGAWQVMLQRPSVFLRIRGTGLCRTATPDRDRRQHPKPSLDTSLCTPILARSYQHGLRGAAPGRQPAAGSSAAGCRRGCPPEAPSPAVVEVRARTPCAGTANTSKGESTARCASSLRTP